MRDFPQPYPKTAGQAQQSASNPERVGSLPRQRGYSFRSPTFPSTLMERSFLSQTRARLVDWAHLSAGTKEVRRQKMVERGSCRAYLVTIARDRSLDIKKAQVPRFERLGRSSPHSGELFRLASVFLRPKGRLNFPYASS